MVMIQLKLCTMSMSMGQGCGGGAAEFITECLGSQLLLLRWTEKA